MAATWAKPSYEPWPPPEPVEAWEAMAEDGWPPIDQADDWDAISAELDEAQECNGDLD